MTRLEEKDSSIMSTSWRNRLGGISKMEQGCRISIASCKTPGQTWKIIEEKTVLQDVANQQELLAERCDRFVTFQATGTRTDTRTFVCVEQQALSYWLCDQQKGVPFPPPVVDRCQAAFFFQ